MTKTSDVQAAQTVRLALRNLRLASDDPLHTLIRLAARQLGCPVAWLAALHEQGQAQLIVQHGLPEEQLTAVELSMVAQLSGPDDDVFKLEAADMRSMACRVPVQGQVVAVLCVQASVSTALAPDAPEVLRDFSRLAGTLLGTHLNEAQWREQVERVRMASMSSSDWLWESDASGRVRWVSTGVETHTGLAPSALIGHTLPQINRPLDDDPSESWARYEDARARLEPFRNVLARRPTPRGTITVSISGTPVFDPAGNFRGYRGATSNVTEHIDAQQAVRAAQRLLRDALDSLSAGVMISDPHGRVVMVNAVWRGNMAPYMTGDATWPEIVNRVADAGDYPDAQNRAAFVTWRLSLASPVGEQHEMRWKDRWVIVSDRLLADGSVVHLSVDITDRKRAEMALAERQAQLSESQAQLSAVLSAVPDLWFVLDAEGHYLACSSASHPMLVHSWDSVKGKSFDAGVPKPLADRVVAAIRRALTSGEVQSIDYDLVTADGVDRTFEARISPMPQQRVLYVTRDLTELRRLERDLLVMQRALEADASLAICVADASQPGLPLIYVNPAFEHLTGYSRADALGQNCRFLQGHLVGQPGALAMKQAIAAGLAISVTLNNVRKDGTVFSNAVHIAPVRDANGLLTHYIGVQRDVTEQSRAADKLRLSEELYRSVAAAISDGLLVVTPTLGIIAINPAACDILGVEQAAVMNAGDAWPFTMLDAREAPLQVSGHPVLRVLSSKQPLVNQTLALRRPDGDLRWISLNAHPLQLRPEGETFSVVLTFRDITRQRASDIALAQAEERWQFALEGSGDGVWDWDSTSNRIFYSTQWKALRGYAEHEISDSPDEWRLSTHPDDLPLVLATIRRHLRHEAPYYELEYRVRHKLGHYLWIRDRGKIVSYDANRRALRVVGTQADITRRKQAEQAMREKQALELASRAKSEFLSRMSHEMRTPLNAVIGFAQLLNLNPAGLDVTTVQDYSGHVLEAGEHLLALIDDVLDLQKIEEGAITLRLQPVDLHDVVTRATELLMPLAQARRVRFEIQSAPGTWVRADPQRLRQILLNAGSNAIKYNRPDGVVRWRFENSAGRVILCVEDNGAGMTEEQMTRLFQPFERLGRETSTIEGTGLGLIIARSLTQAIGGHLDISSRAGLGTSVRIDLPACDAPATQPAAAPPASPPAADRVLRMLYVEDNRINAILFEEAMRMHGNRVELRIAEDGDQALELAQAWQPDVLVLDAHLPGMSGFEVLALLRGLPGLGNTPAYMCSADAMPDDVQRAYEAGFVGYWTKPINIGTVLADVERHLQRTPRAG